MGSKSRQFHGLRKAVHTGDREEDAGAQEVPCRQYTVNQKSGWVAAESERALFLGPLLEELPQLI